MPEYLPELKTKTPQDPDSESPTDFSDLKNLLPLKLQEAMDKIPEEWFAMPEKDLKKLLYKKIEGGNGRQCNTFDMDQRLRISFWQEYESSRSKRRPLSMSNVLEGVMCAPTFYNTFMKSPRRVAWMLYPPLNYKIAIHDLLNRGIDRLYEIMKLPLHTKICRCHYTCWCNKTGTGKRRVGEQIKCLCKPKCICPTKYDSKIADVILKAYERVELRAKGSIPMVVNQNNRSVTAQFHGKMPDNINSIPPQPYESLEGPPPEPETLEDIEKRLLELRAKRNVLTGQAMPIDTTAVEFMTADDPKEQEE